jgi:hypothetical protein
LAAAERHADAALAIREGLTAITPFVERRPKAFGDLARTLTQDYKTACENAGAEPDAALIARVTQAVMG